MMRTGIGPSGIVIIKLQSVDSRALQLSRASFVCGKPSQSAIERQGRQLARGETVKKIYLGFRQ
jgi:hypothetical protein